VLEVLSPVLEVVVWHVVDAPGLEDAAT